MPSFGQDFTAGGGFKAMSQYDAGQSTAMLQRANAGIATQSAQAELQAGSENALVKQQQIQRTIGSEEAATGASGIQAYGSPLKVQQDTAALGAQDLERLRINALRKAWGFSTSAAGDEIHGNLASQQGKLSAVGTLVTGSARSFGDYSQANG